MSPVLLTNDPDPVPVTTPSTYDLFTTSVGSTGVGTLGESLTTLGQRLTQTVSAFNSMATTVEGRVLVTGRKLEKLGAKSEKKLEEPRLVEDLPKQLSAPEFQGNE